MAPRGVDYAVQETTYGNRYHGGTVSKMKQQLWDAISPTLARGGKVVIPAFAVQRNQELVFLLHELSAEGKLQVPVYVDSPLGARATDVYRRHPENQGQRVHAFAEKHGDPYTFKNLHPVTTTLESKRLANVRGPAVIISSAGMGHAGRVVEHLKEHVGNPNDAIVIAGYMAQNTPGRALLNGDPSIRLDGRQYAVAADVKHLTAFSGHADRRGLWQWATGLGSGVKKHFLVHGQPEQSDAFGKLLRKGQKIFGKGRKADVIAPSRGDTYEIE